MTMLLTVSALFVFLLTISSGSVFCCARFGRRFEEALPLTCMGIVFVLFLFGIFGALKAGVYAVFALAATLYGMAGWYLIRSKDRKAFFAGMITPGSMLFALVFCMIAWLNRGRLASKWDEFTHWMAIVKIMTTLDDFGTNPAALAGFASYPPGMSLFQYFLQKIYFIFRPEAIFREDLVYIAYQVLLLSVLFPFFKRTSFKRPLELLLVCGVAFLVPLLFFDNIYATSYIDPVLGVVSGAGLAAVFIEKKTDRLNHVYICMLCAMLVLTKTSGMMFALFLAVAYCLRMLLGDPDPDTAARLTVRKRWLPCGATLACCAVPKILWSHEVSVSGVFVQFARKVQLGRLWEVLTGQDDTYLTTVLDNGRNAWRTTTVALGWAGSNLSYVMIVLLVGAACVLLWRLYKAKSGEDKRARALILAIIPVQILVFGFGLIVMYMFKFSEYEAVNLASFSRYMNTVFLASCMAVMLIGTQAILLFLSGGAAVRGTALALALLMLFVPLEPMRAFLLQTSVEKSCAFRARYEPLTQKIMDTCDGDADILLVSQADNGRAFQVMTYAIRPNRIGKLGWSFGAGPLYEGDRYTLVLTADQLWEELDKNYDYLAIYRLDDTFYENYSELFESPDQIAKGNLFAVDRDSGMLTLVQ